MGNHPAEKLNTEIHSPHPSICICGAGELGSRYLQGLTKLASKVRIKVVDPSDASLATAQRRWVEAGGSHSPHSVEWASVIEPLCKPLDLVIISTSAFERASLISYVSKSLSPRYWIIEKVLAQSSTEVEIIKIDIAKASGAWINTPRRLTDWHRKLKTQFAGQGPLYVSKRGFLWGLACNSIHFIDLISWWSGESLVAIDTSRVDSEWIQSKRAGYFEATGTLVAEFSGGTKLFMTSELGECEEFLKVNLTNGDSWLIDEKEGLAKDLRGIKIYGRLEYQSELTAPMVAEILDNGTCALPSFKESAKQHCIFLDAMLAHWNRTRYRKDQRIPIT
jgi:hypothetical protein